MPSKPSLSSSSVSASVSVEGQTYHVPRHAGHASKAKANVSTSTASMSVGTNNDDVTNPRRRCSDAQTQSGDFNYGGEQVGHVPSRGPSPVLLAPSSPQPPLIPLTTAYAGYDPSYCQLLGQAADGYQYELVRRPSFGLIAAQPHAAGAASAAEQLVVPPPTYSRRSSSTGVAAPILSSSPQPQVMMAAPHSPLPQPPPYAFSSLQGSFDSQVGAPVFIQSHPVVHPPAPPLSPRPQLLLQHHQQQPHQHPQQQQQHLLLHQIHNNPPQEQQPQHKSDSIVPKLIHETSI